MKKKIVAAVIAVLIVFSLILGACGTNIKSASIKQGNFSKHSCETAGCGQPAVCEVKTGKKKHYFCREHTAYAVMTYNAYMTGGEIPDFSQEVPGEEI